VEFSFLRKIASHPSKKKARNKQTNSDEEAKGVEKDFVWERTCYRSVGVLLVSEPFNQSSKKKKEREPRRGKFARVGKEGG